MPRARESRRVIAFPRARVSIARRMRSDAAPRSIASTSRVVRRVVVVAPVEYARAPTAVAHMGANAVVRFVHLKSADRADIAQSTLAEPVVDVCERARRGRPIGAIGVGRCLSSAFYRRIDTRA